MTPEQGAAALSKEPESNYVWLFWPSSGLCPHPTVTALEHTWVVGNESACPCTKKTLCANRGHVSRMQYPLLFLRIFVVFVIFWGLFLF